MKIITPHDFVERLKNQISTIENSKDVVFEIHGNNVGFYDKNNKKETECILEIRFEDEEDLNFNLRHCFYRVQNFYQKKPDNNQINKQNFEVSGDLLTYFQTEEDKKYSLKNNVTKFSAIKYKGEFITDMAKIESILKQQP